MRKYDYLIVGSGLFGAVFAHEMKKKGKSIKILEKRKHIGGNVYTEKVSGIDVHKYGAHIFHTNDENIWNYVNQLVEFRPFINSPVAFSRNGLYNLPFNMNTFYQVFGVKTPSEAKKRIQKEIDDYGLTHKPMNLEEQAISLVGTSIYELLIKDYTEKQWGRKCSELPAFIIKRLPLRFTYNNNYFNDRYQGIPVNGYTELITKLVEGIEVELETDYFQHRDEYDNMAVKVVYTGPIDQFFDYRYGRLDYRSLKFKSEELEMESFQGNAVVNYCDDSEEFTRIIEHKHFSDVKTESTIITKEYSFEYVQGSEPYYPVNDDVNSKKYSKYKDLIDSSKYIFGGRLATYKYYDMHQVIASALKTSRHEE